MQWWPQYWKDDSRDRWMACWNSLTNPSRRIDKLKVQREILSQKLKVENNWAKTSDANLQSPCANANTLTTLDTYHTNNATRNETRTNIPEALLFVCCCRQKRECEKFKLPWLLRVYSGKTCVPQDVGNCFVKWESCGGIAIGKTRIKLI